MARAALIDRLVLIVASRTGWSERDIHRQPLRRLIRYLGHLRNG